MTPLFQKVTSKGAWVEVMLSNPRLARQEDLVLSTDLGGRVLDVGCPGALSAQARRLEDAAALDTLAPNAALLYKGQTGNAFCVYALHEGAAHRPYDQAPSTNLREYIDRLEAPFAAPERHPRCAPAEALALGAFIEDVIDAFCRDLLGRPADPFLLDEKVAEVRTRRKSIVEVQLDIAASDDAATAVFGKRRAPAVSRLRTRQAHLRRLPKLRHVDGSAASTSEAFRRLGLAFDPSLWRADYFDAALAAADGDIRVFARGADPLRLALI